MPGIPGTSHRPFLCSSFLGRGKNIIIKHILPPSYRNDLPSYIFRPTEMMLQNVLNHIDFYKFTFLQTALLNHISILLLLVTFDVLKHISHFCKVYLDVWHIWFLIIWCLDSFFLQTVLFNHIYFLLFLAFCVLKHICRAFCVLEHICRFSLIYV